MDTSNLKYVVGQASQDKPAYMRFYGAVTESSTFNFNEEFTWLTECVKPSKIIIGINSEGGSVLYGMGTFSLIQGSPIETETIIEGLAASMGSILWAAGTRSYMRDYSILMIHNPFLSSSEGSLTPDQEQSINAFKQQLEVIYQRRFGLSKAKVQEIMEGKDGCDGTYFDAKSAVSAGIIPADHVIKTPKQVSTKVKNQLEGVTEIKSMKQIMASANEELANFKPLPADASINKQNQTNTEMNENENVMALSSIRAQLGLQKDSDIAAIVNSLTELRKAATDLKALKNSYNELNIKKEGIEAELSNVKNELKDTKDALKVYQDAEAAKRNADIEAMVDEAIASGKIKAEAKENWVNMAKSHLDMVKETLASIPARDVISQEIAKDPDNVKDAAANATKTEREMEAHIKEVVGNEFKFRSIDE